MFEILFAHFERSFSLSEESKAVIQSVVRPRKLTKGECLQHAGDMARFGAFVTRGLLRSYIIDSKGKEHIIQFAPENWWISDKSLMQEEVKASFFIDAIEDSDILLTDLKGHLTMMEKVPGFAASFNLGLQKRNEAKDKRIVDSLSTTAEERYDYFLKTYSSLANRLPLHMLASYLGITPETLSRIRKNQSQKK